MEVGDGVMEGPLVVLMENDGSWPYRDETDGRLETLERESYVCQLQPFNCVKKGTKFEIVMSLSVYKRAW